MLGISIGPAKEEALMKGMAVLQKNRFKNVSELYSALYNVQTDMPATAHSSTTVPIAAAPSVSVPTPLYAQNTDGTQENRPPVLTAKPKRTTKEKWIIAIACGVAAGTLSIALSMWQSSNSTDTPEVPAFSPPAIELTIPPPSDPTPAPTPAPTPESQSPKDTTHIVTTQLGGMQEFGDLADRQGGWRSDGVDEKSSPYKARDFTESQYLIIEFDRVPNGEVDFVWIGDSNNWVWTSTTFTPQSRILTIDLTQINGYNQYIQASWLKIFIYCHVDTWEDIRVLEVYFANAR